MTEVLPQEKKLRYVEKETDEVKELSYDILLNAAPIDMLVKETKICRELDILHNKVVCLYFLTITKFEK